MFRQLSISNKHNSKGREILITDGAGDLVYRAVLGSGFLSPKWLVENKAAEVATLKRKMFAPVYMVSSGLGEFSVKRKLSLMRKYHVMGGSYDDTVAEANAPNSQISIKRADKLLASVQKDYSSHTNAHLIDVHDTEDTAEFTVVIMMICYFIDLNREKQQQSASESD